MALLPKHESVYKAILVLSINHAKARALYEKGDVRRLRTKARQMAQAVRGQPGVRHTEAIVMNRWWPDPPTRRAPNEPQPPHKAPWTPCGALVIVEASAAAALDRHVRGVLNAARAIDQEAMEAFGTDIW